MDEQEPQKSCWGVAIWSVLTFLFAFTVFSLFVEHDLSEDAVSSAPQENTTQ